MADRYEKMTLGMLLREMNAWQNIVDALKGTSSGAREEAKRQMFLAEAWYHRRSIMAKWGEIKCREAASKCPRCEELEAKLAKAVEMALEECPFREDTGSYNDWWHYRRTALAELTGGNDE